MSISSPDADPERPISAVGMAVLTLVGGGVTATVSRLRAFVLDPDDTCFERWQLLRAAERDAWKAVELLLLKRSIERRFREGELDAWERVTPFAEDIRRGLEDFYEHHVSLTFPSEPRSFTAFAYQELRAARLAGALHAEWPTHGPNGFLLALAQQTVERFQNLAQVIMHPGLDIPGMAWGFLRIRLGANEALLQQFAAAGADARTPQRLGVVHLATPFMTCPELVEEFVGDTFAAAMLQHRVKRAETRARNRQEPTQKEEGEFEHAARAEVERTLGQSEVIRATTLAEAVADAERLKVTHDLMVAINSLWGWYCALPANHRQAIGQFEGRHGKHRLWASARTQRW